GFVFWTAAAAAPSFPALTGRVVDGANILSSQTRASLDAKLEALETKTSRQLVVVTVPTLQGYEIEDYGYQLGRVWG
ncbi:TPM domain-containing protein, partial [Klebsiella pneumoniae]|uniref:TPM domain-containing protein n=1 Tax=Klebsiella pneumoniae TaxID=573 RepID=UPI0013D0F8C4